MTVMLSKLLDVFFPICFSYGFLERCMGLLVVNEKVNCPLSTRSVITPNVFANVIDEKIVILLTEVAFSGLRDLARAI